MHSIPLKNRKTPVAVTGVEVWSGLRLALARLNFVTTKVLLGFSERNVLTKLWVVLLKT
jgi:hypothetical protein